MFYMNSMELLKQLCEIHGPSGNEVGVKEFIVRYVEANQTNWLNQPEIIQGDEFQDCVMLKFGEPRIALFAHMDTVGFTVRYQNQLVPIGQPDLETGYRLVGADSLGPVDCELIYQKGAGIRYAFGRGIEPGSQLVFKPDFREDENFVQCAGLDNRLGVYVALKLAETLQNGLIVFTCWEEHGGGSVPILARHIYEQFSLRTALICDITWATEGVIQGAGVAVSVRDANIPRRNFINKIIELARESKVDFQIEVEGDGSSDGRELQKSPYPIDWCFIGAPEDNIHSPHEIVHKHDIYCMIELYRFLMNNYASF